MNARSRHILMLAMTTAWMTPLALAQSAQGGQGKAIGETSARVPPPAPPRSPPPALPPQASSFASDALLNTNAPPSVQTLNQTQPPSPPKVEEAAMNPPRPPVKAQGATHAAGHAASVQRSAWAQLDVNGDGRISGSEGQVDADFRANFEMMDANDDGFVTEVEYSAQAKGEQQEPEEERDD